MKMISKGLNNLTVVIKTFIRPKTCENLVAMWRSIYGEELKIIVVDDGGPDMRPDFSKDSNTNHIILPFDSGASLGRNVGVKASSTDLIFYSDDDNSPPSKDNLIKCVDILVNNEIDILGWRAYQCILKNETAIIKKKRLSEAFAMCDFTLQHFLAKRERMLLWDESLKISGEHFDYFMRCKQEEIKVAGTELLSFVRVLKDERRVLNGYTRWRRRKQFGAEAMKKWGVSNVKWVH